MGSFDIITYYLLKKFKPKLSRLIIDVDKDWMGHVIKNLGTPIDPYDALRLIELNVHKSAIPLDHPDGSVTTEKIADGAITDAKVSSISRNKITDFWNTPFWDNIPDKPSTFPPEPHTHLRSEISDFWNTPFWNNIPDKPHLFEVISDLTVETNSDYVEWTDLDINSHGAYVIFATVKNPLSSDYAVRLYANGDITDANYYHQAVTFDNTAIFPARGNNPSIFGVWAKTTSFAVIYIVRDVDGRMRAVSNIVGNNPSRVMLQLRAVASINTFVNITTLRLQSSISGGISSGSRFILCRVKSL